MLILKKIALIAPIMIRWVSIGCLFKSPMTALPWKRGPVRGKCSGSTLSPAGFLFVCDILRCNAMPRLTPGCDVTHFDWQLHCSAGFNSFLSGDSAANPREKRRPRDTNTHTHTHGLNTGLQTSSVSLRCLPAAVEAAGWIYSMLHRENVGESNLPVSVLNWQPIALL